MNTGPIWVVINCDDVSEKLRNNIDHGSFAEANAIKYQLDSLSEKLKSLISVSGGSLHIAVPDRVVFQVPLTLAEQMPAVLAGYREFFGDMMAVGLGMDMSEAATASIKSKHSGEIELYDPSDESFNMYKSDDFFISPNLFDPMVPKKQERPSDDRFIPGLDANAQLEAEAKYIQGLVQQLGGQDAQAMQQQMQQQMAAQQQSQLPPRNLLEALHGQQISNGPGPEGQEESGQSGQESGQSGQQLGQSSQESGQSGQESEESDDHNEKLSQLLGTVKQQIPQIMQLADSNPETFKQTLNLVHKLLAVTKEKHKNKKTKAEKSELLSIVEELNKKMKYPVGTKKGRKVKVQIGNKTAWRSMASGQLRDNNGTPISVKANNSKANKEE